MSLGSSTQLPAMATPEQSEVCMPLPAAPNVATFPALGWVASTLSPLAKEFHPSEEWPVLPVAKKLLACLKLRMQGRARSLRV